MSTLFKPGDRVTRPEDVYDRRSPQKHGTVQRVYRMDQCPINSSDNHALRLHVFHDTYHKLGKCSVYGPYEELYEVLWDSGEVQRGFLPHGLSLEKDEPQGYLQRKSSARTGGKRAHRSR